MTGPSTPPTDEPTAPRAKAAGCADECTFAASPAGPCQDGACAMAWAASPTDPLVSYPSVAAGVSSRTPTEDRTDETPKFAIVGDFLCVEVDGCTCDGGHEFPHRDYCGLEPAISLAEMHALLAGETPRIYAEIAAERERAHAKHGDKSMESAAWDDMKRLRILMEEVGEIAKVFNELDLGVITLAVARQQCRKECIQTAAMATAWAEGAGRG